MDLKKKLLSFFFFRTIMMTLSLSLFLFYFIFFLHSVFYTHTNQLPKEKQMVLSPYPSSSSSIRLHTSKTNRNIFGILCGKKKNLNREYFRPKKIRGTKIPVENSWGEEGGEEFVPETQNATSPEKKKSPVVFIGERTKIPVQIHCHIRCFVFFFLPS